MNGNWTVRLEDGMHSVAAEISEWTGKLKISRRSFLGASAIGLVAPRVLRSAPPATNADCVFCQIIRGAQEATLVWQDELCVAFGSLYPLEAGHVLLVPRQHVETLYTLPPDVGAHLLPVASRIGVALRDVLHADGLSVRQNNGKAAGQTVFHFHLHLIPRREGHEIFKTLVDPPMATPAQLEAVLAPVRKALRP